MKGENLKKEIELREWQKKFNPSRTTENKSIILKKNQSENNESEKKTESQFCW